MILDVLTVQVLCGLIITVSGASFILNTAFRAYDRAGLYWSLCFVAGILSSLIYVLDDNFGGWIFLALANSTFVLAMGSMWSGMRLFNGRNSGVLWVVAAAAACACVVPIFWESAGTWSGGVIYLAAVAVFAVLAGAEALGEASRSSVHARILAGALITAGVYLLARALFLLTQGGDRMSGHPIFGSGTSTAVIMGLLVVVAVSMSSMRAERDVLRGLAYSPRDSAVSFSIGVLAAEAFDVGASDRVARVNMHGVPVALIHTELDGMDAFRVAYGPDAVREATARFARVLRASVPPTAIIGHLGGGRFALLAVLDEAIEGRDIGRSILNALSEEPIDEARGLRMSASIGVAQQSAAPIIWERLVSTAAETLEKAREIGGNVIQETFVASPGSRPTDNGHKLLS